MVLGQRNDSSSTRARVCAPALTVKNSRAKLKAGALCQATLPPKYPQTEFNQKLFLILD